MKTLETIYNLRSSLPLPMALLYGLGTPCCSPRCLWLPFFMDLVPLLFPLLHMATLLYGPSTSLPFNVVQVFD